MTTDFDGIRCNALHQLLCTLIPLSNSTHRHTAHSNYHYNNNNNDDDDKKLSYCRESTLLTLLYHTVQKAFQMLNHLGLGVDHECDRETAEMKLYQSYSHSDLTLTASLIYNSAFNNKYDCCSDKPRVMSTKTTKKSYFCLTWSGYDGLKLWSASLAAVSITSSLVVSAGMMSSLVTVATGVAVVGGSASDSDSVVVTANTRQHDDYSEMVLISTHPLSCQTAEHRNIHIENIKYKHTIHTKKHECRDNISYRN